MIEDWVVVWVVRLVVVAVLVMLRVRVSEGDES